MSNKVTNEDEERPEQTQNTEQQNSRQIIHGANRYVKVDKLALEL